MIYKYATITDTNKGSFFSSFVYVLNFLNEVDNINECKEFKSFDEAVVFLGSLGYNLCSTVTYANSTTVFKGWFSKNFES